MFACEDKDRKGGIELGREDILAECWRSDLPFLRLEPDASYAPPPKSKKKMEQENDRLVAAQREVYEEVGLVNQEARFANMVS